MISRTQVELALVPLITSGLALLLSSIVTFALAASDIANYGMSQYLILFGLTLLTMGLDQSFLRELPSSTNPSLLLAQCLQPTILMLVLFGTLTFLLSSESVVRPIANNYTLTISTFFVNLLFVTANRFSAQFARLRQQARLLLVTEWAARLPIVIFLLWKLTNGDFGTFQQALVCLCIGSALSAFIHTICNWSLWINVPKYLFCKIEGTEKLIRFGAPLAAAGILYWGTSYAGTFIARHQYGGDAVSSLVVAASFAQIAAIFQSIHSFIWLPWAYQRLAHDTTFNAQRVGTIARHTTVLAATAFVVIVPILQFAVPIVVSRYHQSALVLSIPMAVTPLMYMISEVTQIGLMASKKTHYSLLATLITFLVSILFTTLLVLAMGPIGAALAIPLSAMAFLTARTEFACSVWGQFPRRSLYFGWISILLCSVFYPLLSAETRIGSLLFLAPYFFLEWPMAKKIFGTLRREIAQRRKFIG